jgi:ribonuclease VapC
MVLDTSAIVAILLKEPGFEALLAKIEAAPVVAVGTPTLLECAMVMASRVTQDARVIVTGVLRKMNAQVVPFSEEHFDAAIEAFLRFGRGRHPAGLNFGDCTSYAVAVVAGLPLLFTGGDFARTDIPAA